MRSSSRLAEAAHIMLLLYLLQDDCKLSSEVIARSLAINPTVVRRLLGQLKSAGLVHVPPKKGGARALRPAAEVTLWDLCLAVGEDGPLFSFHPCEKSACPVAKNLHGILDGPLHAAREACRSQLEGATLESLFRELTEARGVTREAIVRRGHGPTSPI